MRQAVSTRQALVRLIDAGMTGTYQTLAAAAGVPAKVAQGALWELSRTGRASASRHGGRAPAVYARPRIEVDSLAYVRQVWR